jgi:multiphosphoryl transfer protein
MEQLPKPMVGLVIVTHSRALGEALLDFIKPMASPDVPIAVAAGVGPDREELGTDALEIQEAIRSVFSKDGVLVIMDLGSALLSAELALELLEPEISEYVRLCPAPIVEGGLAAAVQIGLGSSLDTVYQEAQQSLLPKIDQIGDGGVLAVTAQETAAEFEHAASELVLTLKNQHGLHARPAARFVRAAGNFDSEVLVYNLTKGKGPVRASSLNELATLGALRDHQIRIQAKGPQASEALEALKILVEDNFGEKDQLPQPEAFTAASKPPQEGNVQGRPVSPGIAIGPFYPYRAPEPPVPEYNPADPNEEWQKLQSAIGATSRKLEQRYQQILRELGEAEAGIFEAHLLILEDTAILEKVHKLVKQDRKNAAFAWNAAILDAADAFRNMEDSYFQQRAADVLDVGRQVLYALAGKHERTDIKFESPVVLYAEDLTPTETSQLDMDHILGIMTAAGGGTSHSAILARAKGIPSVSSVSASIEKIKPGTIVALDGSTGAVWIEPPDQVLQELRRQQSEWVTKRKELLKASRAVTFTRDGHRVEVFANIGSPQDAHTAVDNGAEGVGLLRTEFLFLDRSTPPDEETQVGVLEEIGAALQGLPVTVRTLDVGGDKDVPYLNLPHEANPFLGVRAIRISLAQPDLFLVQLRAILRAGARYPFRIMFPMIASVEEIWQARKCLEKAHETLELQELPHAWPVETGIMVETPSAAILSPILAKEVDFFSIGTNDLTQYTLAAERGNPMLTGLMDAMHPAVLQLIKTVADAAHQNNIWVGVCGELAGDPEAAPLLVGLGIDELSLYPGGIPDIKDILRKLDSREAQKLAGQVLQVQNTSQARKLAANFLENLV